MADYTGKKCLACGSEFTRSDDIVVCPDCGTPYHRQCYAEKGECINYELHSRGGSWSAEQSAKEAAARNAAEEIKCPRCGGSNSADALFCNYCGLPLGIQQGAQQQFNDGSARSQETYGGAGGMFGGGGNPFGGSPYGMPGFGGQTQKFTAESDIDGNTLGEYAGYIGSNKSYFMTQFIRFAKFAKKVSFSFIGFVFPEFYYFYRKMFKEGVLVALAMFVLSVPSMVVLFHKDSEYFKLFGEGLSVLANDVNIKAGWFNVCYNICYYGTWLLQLFCGLMTNYIYYRKAKRDIDRVKARGGTSEEAAAKGGTSAGAMILAFVVYMALTTVTLVAMHYRSDIMGYFG